MQKVITINLNGNAYQLDERGYDALVAYLDQAERNLASNPDRDEIVADLEQAIAEKCVRFLGPAKTVVTGAEVARIIEEMGPVNNADNTEGDASSTPDAPAGGQRTSSGAPRRLYLIREGAMVGGVCTGIAAFLGIDVTIVRIMFLVFAVLTRGFGVLAYFVLMFVIPSAITSEERAAAHGQPFNAQELIDRAKKNYEQFRGSDWRGRWRRQRREWRRMRRHHLAGWWPPPGGSVPPTGPMAPVGYATRVVAGFLVPIFTFAHAASFWAMAFVVLSVIANHAAFGVDVPADVPIWAAVLGVGLLYSAISWPLHAARRASYYAVAGPQHALVAAWDGLLAAGFGVLIFWLAYQYVVEFRELVHSVPEIWESIRTALDNR